jgi:hypothetical protein
MQKYADQDEEERELAMLMLGHKSKVHSQWLCLCVYFNVQCMPLERLKVSCDMNMSRCLRCSACAGVLLCVYVCVCVCVCVTHVCVLMCMVELVCVGILRVLHVCMCV